MTFLLLALLFWALRVPGALEALKAGLDGVGSRWPLRGLRLPRLSRGLSASAIRITLALYLFYIIQEEPPEIGIPTQLSQGIGDLQEMGVSHKAVVRGAQVLATVQAHMPIPPACASGKCLNIHMVDFEL